MLRGKTIECISLIGLAVGSEKFMPDAQVSFKFVKYWLFLHVEIIPFILSHKIINNCCNLSLGYNESPVANASWHKFLGRWWSSNIIYDQCLG